MAWNPTYKINLLDIIKRAYSDTKVQDKLRPRLSESAFKTLYAQRVIDFMVNRTKDGLDKNMKKFKTYSTSYKKSLVFQIYKEGSDVDLTLTGEMLESLRSSNSRFTVTVFLDGQNNKDKAQGHISGKYGKSKTNKKRDFLGLTASQEVEIFKGAVEDYADLNKLTLTELSI